MTTIRTAILSIITVFIICIEILNLTTVNADSYFYELSSNVPVNVYYENYIEKQEDGFIHFSSDNIIYLDKFYDMSIFYLIDESVSDVDNNYLELSDNYGLEKLKSVDGNLYKVNVDDEAQLNELFENAQNLYDNKKIKNAYTNKNITYMNAYEHNGKLIYEELCRPANLKKYLMYSEESINNSIILGDANSDCTLNVRDCAFTARTLAMGKGDSLPVSSDFNKDGKVNVRDAAAIASYLSKGGK